MYASCSCAEAGVYERARDRDSTLSRADVLLWIRGHARAPMLTMVWGAVVSYRPWH